MWLMLQQDRPDDYVVATGETHSVKELVELAFAAVDLDWEQHVVIDERFLRPAEVDLLVGDPAKAEATLGWYREVDFPKLVQMMVEADLALVKSQRDLSRPCSTRPPSTPIRSVCWWRSAPACSRSSRRACCPWCRPTCRWSRGSRPPS